ncbi:MAG: hypothetical protein WC518_03560 [Patescibacteria group bacterium]
MKKQIYNFTLNLEKKVLIVAVLIFTFQLLFPQYSHAYSVDFSQTTPQESILALANSQEKVIFNAKDETDFSARLVLADWNRPKRRVKVTVTAYSSTVDQCDSDPFTTANGSRVKDGIVATNFLPFGTKIKLPEIFGDRVFSVEDRMNPRYHYYIDVWMSSREAAKQFGVKYVEAEIY